MSNRNSMDVDRETPNGSGTPPPPQHAPQSTFTVPIQNGAPASSPMNIDTDAPEPPAHTSGPPSPAADPAEEAEAFKAAGNKLFKEKEYNRAAEEYSKGE